MRFLFVINTFYPESVAASAIVMNLADHLINSGYQVDVLTLRKDESISEFETFNGINIFRVVDYNLLSRGYVEDVLKGKFSFFFKFKIVRNYFWGKLFRPIQMKITRDNIVTNRTRLYKKRLEELITDNNYKSIVTVNGDLSGAVAATQLKIEKKNFRFIFYQVDPYTNNYVYSNKNKPKRYQIEKEIFKYSDGIIMPSSNYLDVITNKFEEYNNKISIVEFPKIQKLNYKPTVDDILLDKNFVNIIYTGMLYKDIRNPKYVLELLTKINMDNIKIYFVGCSIPEDSSELVKRMRDKIYIINRISQQAVSNLLLNSDILINIGNSVVNTFPSKLFEYFSSGKPIINFYKSTSCPTLMYSKKYPEILNIYEEYANIDDNANKIEKFIFDNHKKVQYNVVKEIFSECTVSEVGKQFEKVLKDEQ